MELTKEIQKNIKKHNLNLTADDFKMNAERYINACKERRLICNIVSVSKSGMSRNLEVKEFCFKESGVILNFYSLFCALGYTPVKSGGFRISGCGMDMVFHTNYSIVHDLHRLGFISKEECAELSQQSIHII